jgi:hypothetical protein
MRSSSELPILAGVPGRDEEGDLLGCDTRLLLLAAGRLRDDPVNMSSSSAW